MNEKKQQIVIIGAGVLDVLVRSVDETVFRTGSFPVEDIRLATGGDALNEATILARLGCRPALVSIVGEDEAGRMLLSHCRKEGISTELVKRSKELATGVNVVMVQDDGSRSFFTDPKSSLRRLSLEHIPARFPDDASILCLASIFVSPCLGVREMTEIFKRAKAQGMTVCADMTKCKNHERAEDIREVLTWIDYLFVNEEEAAMLCGQKNVEELASVLFSCGARNVIIKCGARGCYVKNQELSRQFPALPAARCVDTTGAGDAFAAGFLCALSEGRTLEECIMWASASGSLTVEKVGAVSGVSTRSQVEARIAGEDLRL